jgi:hypothetical protein
LPLYIYLLYSSMKKKKKKNIIIENYILRTRTDQTEKRN